MKKRQKPWTWFSTLCADRLIITDDDLRAAQRFLKEYLDRKLHDQWGPPEGIVAEAFTAAIVVTYARPFSSRNDRAGKREEDKLSFLTETLPERGDHDEAIMARHHWFAHSDAQPRDVQSDGKVSTMHDISPLEKADAEALLRNVAAMRAALKPLIDQLHP